MSIIKSKDISNLDLNTKAEVLTLHFIGYIDKPTGISDELYQRCSNAFIANRGQFEWEYDAVYGVLKLEKSE